MIKLKDLKGKKFGRLTVIEFDRERTKRKAYWKCKCECGNIKSYRSDQIQSGNTKSCGCYKSEVDSKKAHKLHKHKLSGTPIYARWLNIKSRCFNENNKSYKRYGGRGITICDEWKNDFIIFYNWCINNGFKKELSIDRIDNNKGYSPDNCRFVGNVVQCNNRRTNIIVNYNGKEMRLAEISEILNIPLHVLYDRYERGDRDEWLLRPVGVRSSRGANCHLSKITEKQAIEIKSRLKNNESPIEISKSMNISKYIVYDIKREKTWSWL